MSNSKNGFTLVELLIVIVVIAILAAITMVAYNGISIKAKDAAKLTAVNQFIRQLTAYKAEYDVYPDPKNNNTEYYVAHTTPQSTTKTQALQNFESTYGIKIPDGVLYYSRTNNMAPEISVTYVMASFNDNNNIPQKNQSNRLKSGSNNIAFPQLVLYSENKCDLPIDRLSADANQSTSGYGGSYGLLRDAIKSPNDNGSTYTGNPDDSYANGDSISFYTVTNYSSCGRVGYLEDGQSYDLEKIKTRKSGVGLFVLYQGER